MVIIYQSPSQTWLVVPLLPEGGVAIAPERDDDFSPKVSFPVHCEPLRRASLGSGERGFQQLSLFFQEIPLCWCQKYECEKLSLFHGNIRQDSGAQHSLKGNHKQTSAEINQVLSFHVFPLIFILLCLSALCHAVLLALLAIPFTELILPPTLLLILLLAVKYV